MMSRRPSCCECGVTSPAYRCPTCCSFYCSAKCCKEHKQKECTLATNAVENNISDDTNYQHSTEDTVELEKLKLLGENKELIDYLKNSQMRKILTDINNHPNPEKTLKFYMQQESFCEFADIILKIVEPQQNKSELDDLFKNCDS